MIIQCVEIFQNGNIPLGDWIKSDIAVRIYWLLIGFAASSLLNVIFKKPKIDMASTLSFAGRHKFAIKYVNKSIIHDLHNIQVKIALVTNNSRFPRPIPILFEEIYTRMLYKRRFLRANMCSDIVEFTLDDENMILFCNGGYIEVSISGETKYGSKRIKVKRFYLSSDAKVYSYEEGNSIKLQRDISEDSIEYRMKYAEYIDNSFYYAYIKNAEIIPIK